ncbi:cilia- and flagella-associated protein 206-like [Orbicella faveolata]|uniref:cilia- and flagella-associated protein 206-like n=1 Tax=Orbicella faveolata TaxID=48498 RepID=UPI0009E4189E|nr:cilia- and flagella-associated protein 206-like [Orbicella faveolata]
MSRAQAESVIKNIIREIAQECASKGQAVSETLVAFMVKAVVLDPDNEFNVDRTLTKDDVQKLIMLCVDRLLDSQSPSLDTVKMQVYFDMNYTSRGITSFKKIVMIHIIEFDPWGGGPDKEASVKEVFKDTAVNVTVGGQKHLGAVIGSREYLEETLARR